MSFRLMRAALANGLIQLVSMGTQAEVGPEPNRTNGIGESDLHRLHSYF
jgi:hypothetical protein